jgi:hypothetical protein
VEVAGCDAAGLGFYGGASLYFLKPFMPNNPAYRRFSGIGGGVPSVDTSDFGWGYQTTPEFWLGWSAPNGLGVRAGYFFFQRVSNSTQTALNAADAGTTFIDPSPNLTGFPSASFGSPGIVMTNAGLGTDQLSFQSDLGIRQLDLEVSYARECRRLSLLASAGLRYLHLDQNYVGSLVNATSSAGSGILESQWLSFGHNFDGFGPTAALQGQYRLGDTGLSLYGNLRGSLLVGSSRSYGYVDLGVVDPVGVAGGNQGITSYTSSHGDHIIPTVELGLGLQYTLLMSGLAPYIRAGLVNKTYFDAGNASSERGNLSLFGAELSLGLSF